MNHERRQITIGDAFGFTATHLEPASHQAKALRTLLHQSSKTHTNMQGPDKHGLKLEFTGREMFQCTQSETLPAKRPPEK